jgi:hypothetical protein
MHFSLFLRDSFAEVERLQRECSRLSTHPPASAALRTALIRP